jgi:hypothetical protein
MDFEETSKRQQQEQLVSILKQVSKTLFHHHPAHAFMATAHVLQYAA